MTTGATAAAAFVMIIFVSLANGLVETLQRNAIGMQISAAQIHVPGFRSERAIHQTIGDAGAVIGALETAGFAAAPRLYAYGLAAAEKSSAAVEIQGLDERERRVTAIARHLRDGRWIDPSDPRGVVVGKILAERLDVNVGSELMILGQAADGSTANELLVVRGILRPIGERIDRTGVIVPAGKFRELFILDPDRGAHEIAIAATDLEAVRTVVRAADPTLEVLTWRELEPSLARMTDAAAARCLLLLLITYLAVVIVVTNATLMSVFERIRQFGIMKAIGTTPSQIARIILAEVLIQSAVAVAIAALLALPVCIYLQNTGLDLSHIIDEISIGGAAMDPIWFGDFSAGVFVLPAAIIFLSAIFASVYPGIKAALIRPVEALARS